MLSSYAPIISAEKAYHEQLFGDDIAAVHHAACHVLAVAWIALHKHGSRLEDGHGDLSHGELLMVCFLCRNDWCVAGKHEVNAWVRHQVGLELGDVDVERTIETQGGCERGDDLRQETVQVGVCWPLNVQVAAADVVERLVIIHDCYIGVLKQRVDTKHSVVRLNDCSGHLWTSPDSETQL